MRYTMFGAMLALWAVAMAPEARAQAQDWLAEHEQQAMTDTVQHALEFNPTRQASEWVSPDSGHSGTVVPVRTFENARRQPCREFITTIIIGGKEEQGYGTACRQADGNWQIVADEQQSAPRTPPQVIAVAPPPVYYAYPSGFYGPSSIFLSFSYVYRGGHAHYGHRYLDGPTFRRRYPGFVPRRSFAAPRRHR